MNGNEGMAGGTVWTHGPRSRAPQRAVRLFVCKLLFHLQDLWLSNSLLFPSLLYISLFHSPSFLHSFFLSVSGTGFMPLWSRISYDDGGV